MSATDRLKAYRDKRGGDGEDGQADEKPESKPSDRSVMLTDVEKKSIGSQYQPGATVECEVTGRMDGDGKLDIIEIRLAAGAVDANAGMPIRTNPMIAPS